MIRLALVLLVIFSFGCTFGTSPAYIKLNQDGAFLLTQPLNKDILCVEAEEQPDKKIKTVRCFYVSGKFNSEEGRWAPPSSSSSL